ncbi:MAG: DUF3524 domain-containing protein [Bacteroidia bacterium]|nr:DUF3524 domain-containing protein [Bacteroidia bacterium]
MKLNILILEPYYTGSHKKWADDIINHSDHTIELITMPGRFWKWRMEGSAIYLSEVMSSRKELPHLVVCSSMLDLGFLKGLLSKEWHDIPFLYYMHENQLTYPVSKLDRDSNNQEKHYGFINLKSCLVADAVLFNSQYHRKSFITAAIELMTRLPDYKYNMLESTLLSKSDVIPLGIDFQLIESIKPALDHKSDLPVLLWNHRWEYDKRPDLFLNMCRNLADKGIKFKIRFLGQNHENTPKHITEFYERFPSLFDYFGYAESYEKYIQLIKGSHILPVSSEHDFLGISVIEALFCGLQPVLPEKMVYQEHLPAGFDYCFYQGQDQFIEKTRNTLLTLSEYDYTTVNQHLRKKYNISDTIACYDKYFIKKGA